MASITLKDIPEDVHAQLKAEAELNLRSLNQEAIIRIQRSFEVADHFSTVAVQTLINEAIASGPEQTFTEAELRKRFEQVRTDSLRKRATEHRAV